MGGEKCSLRRVEEPPRGRVGGGGRGLRGPRSLAWNLGTRLSVLLCSPEHGPRRHLL